MPNSKTSKNVQKMLKKCQKMKNMSKKEEKMKNACFSDLGISVWHNPCQLTLINTEKDEIQYAQRVVESIQGASSIQ
jgi:hypothetical protein